MFDIPVCLVLSALCVLPVFTITNLQTATACESYTMELRCERHEYISISNANYGRTNSGTCPHENDVNRNCYSRGSLDRIKDLCNGQQFCSIQASNSLFGDPCPGTAKFLFVQYRCMERQNRV